MIARLARTSILTLAALALTGSVALSQTAPAPPSPDQSASPSAGAPAPVERRAPYARPGGQNGPRPGMQRGASFNRSRMPQKGHFGPGQHFRGPQRESFGMAERLGMGPAGMWWKNPMVVQRLSLTADQTKRMDDIFQKSRLELIDLRAKLETQNALLDPILSATPFDSAKALAQIDKVAEARAELEKSEARMLIGIRGVLTPDQWTKLHERQGFGRFGEQGGPEGQAGPGAGGPGRGRANNLIDPIDLP